MAEILNLVPSLKDDSSKKTILEIIDEFRGMAERDELEEIIIVASGKEERVFCGASGQVKVSTQIGLIELLKLTLIERMS